MLPHIGALTLPKARAAAGDEGEGGKDLSLVDPGHVIGRSLTGIPSIPAVPVLIGSASNGRLSWSAAAAYADAEAPAPSGPFDTRSGMPVCEQLCC